MNKYIHTNKYVTTDKLKAYIDADNTSYLELLEMITDILNADIDADIMKQDILDYWSDNNEQLKQV